MLVDPKTQRPGQLQLLTASMRPLGRATVTPRKAQAQAPGPRALAFSSGRFMISPMTEAEIAKLATWLAKAGLEGRTETALVEGFCGRAVAGGLPLVRAILFIDTLHPIHEGRAVRGDRRFGAQESHPSRWRTRVPVVCRVARGLDQRLRGGDQSFRRRRRHRRDGLHLFVMDDRSSRRLH